MVKYLYKNKRPVGIVWAEKKDYATGTVVIAGITLLAVALTAIAWWKMNQPAAGLSRRLSTCHTCGGV